MMKEHTEAALPYHKTVKRKLYHSTGLDDLDFITYFETSKLEDFHSLILALEKVKEFQYNETIRSSDLARHGQDRWMRSSRFWRSRRTGVDGETRMTTGTLTLRRQGQENLHDRTSRIRSSSTSRTTRRHSTRRSAGTIVEKGIINNKVSERLFRLLEQSGVPTHFVERKSDREMLTKKVTIVPVEVVVRNVVAGSLAKRLGLKEGEAILPAIVEWYYKNDALGDPLIADDHVRLLNLATPEQLVEIKRLALKVNSVLQPFFA